MGYKPDRVGIAYFHEATPPVSADISGTWVADRANFNYAIDPNVVFPIASSYTQFGVVRANLNNSGTLPARSAISFGQMFTCPEVANGNAVLLEMTACLEGSISERTMISHRFGRLSLAPPSAFGVGIYNGIPTTLKVLDRIGTATGSRWRRFTSSEKIMVRADDLANALLAHSVEITDTESATAVGASDMRLILGLRTIHLADVVKPYDPTR